MEDVRLEKKDFVPSSIGTVKAEQKYRNKLYSYNEKGSYTEKKKEKFKTKNEEK